jgi:hypothetical protein
LIVVTDNIKPSFIDFMKTKYRFHQRGEPHIRASNDRFIKLQTLGKISLSELRIIFDFWITL